MGRSVTSAPSTPAAAAAAQNLIQSKLQNGIQVREDDEPGLRLLADLLRHIEHAGQIGSVLQRALAGALDHRAIGDGIAEGNAQLDDVGAGAIAARATSREMSRSGSPQVM